MSVKNKTNKHYKRSQKGRSMVEMLGVLAIVGVLSVGGISAYGVAMKKHKANELLHQASMLATTISAQAMTNDGKLPETVASFGNSSYGTFLNTVGETADKTGFTITISEMDSPVCTQLEKMAGGMVREATCDDTTATLTYYKNLATTEAEGAKSPTGGNDLNKDVDTGVCENGNPYLSFMVGFGDDPCKTQLSGVSCSSDADCTDGCCHLEKKICIARDIYDENTDTYSCPQFNCIKNSDCANGEFCNLKSHMTEEPLAPAYGTCQSIGEVKEAVFEDSGETYYYSIDLELSWWGAENWCKAQGLSMTEFPMKVWAVCRGEGIEASERCMSEFPNLFSPPVSASFWMGLCDNYEGCFRLHPISDNPIKEVTRNQTYNAICQSA